MKQLVTISRQFGSGGRIIGSLLAEKMGVPMYDKQLIQMAANESGLSPEIVESAELRAKSSFAYTLASAVSFNQGMSGETISMNDQLFLTQFNIIREIGERGKGIIVGRCADYVFREMPDVTNVFLYAPMEERIRRAVEEYGLKDEKTAEETVKSYDKARKNYYNYHTSQKWGQIENYDLALNTGILTEEDAASLIYEYVKRRK